MYIDTIGDAENAEVEFAALNDGVGITVSAPFVPMKFTVKMADVGFV